MQKMEKRRKGSQERASKARNRMATSTREKVASQFTSKRTSGEITAQIFDDYGGRGSGRRSR